MRRIPPRSLDGPPDLPPSLSFVLGLSPSAMTLGLGNIRKLLTAVGNPQRRFESVVIAGTNGKGSVSAYLAAILRSHGWRTGLYTSPHVYSVNERVSVDGEAVPISVMEEAASRIAPLYESIGYSYFEALTAIAFLVFAEFGIEIAVLETGLGGRFDATNVVEPRVSILTGISLDHRRILGDTEEEILREKLGITRPGVPLICGSLSTDLRKIVEGRAHRENIPLTFAGDAARAELRRMSFDGMRALVRTDRADYGDIPLPFLGRHQLGNALVAIRAAELLIERLDRLAPAAALARLPGRFEVRPFGGKTLIFDVAHNDESLIAASRTLGALSPRDDNAMILGILRRKEISSFQREFPLHVRAVYLVEPVVGESYTAAQLLQRFEIENFLNGRLDVSMEGPTVSDGDSTRFMRRVLSSSNRFTRLLVTGSHRTVELFGRAVDRLESE